jgi:hypothetical protein
MSSVASTQKGEHSDGVASPESQHQTDFACYFRCDLGDSGCFVCSENEAALVA